MDKNSLYQCVHPEVKGLIKKNIVNTQLFIMEEITVCKSHC